MTQIELRAYELACSFFSKFSKEKEIDWEQRRYEIAKDVFSYRFANSGIWNCRFEAKYAVSCADELIEVLKEKEKEL